jgi:hypothetical protein
MENLSLASGHITPDAKIVVELVDPEMPMITIRWPAKPTAVSPNRYDEIASRAMRILANASTELAACRRRRRAQPEPQVVDDLLEREQEQRERVAELLDGLDDGDQR